MDYRLSYNAMLTGRGRDKSAKPRAAIPAPVEQIVKPMFCNFIQKCHRGGHCEMCNKNLVFEIEQPSELAAGLIGFNDEITISVESGNPGGEEGEFAEHMLNALKEWYDGAGIRIKA